VWVWGGGVGALRQLHQAHGISSSSSSGSGGGGDAMFSDSSGLSFLLSTGGLRAGGYHAREEEGGGSGGGSGGGEGLLSHCSLSLGLGAPPLLPVAAALPLLFLPPLCVPLMQPPPKTPIPGGMGRVRGEEGEGEESGAHV
jgi:hypothetical protein